MGTFMVTVLETLKKTVGIKAKNEENVIERAREMYNNEEIVLYAGDHCNTEFKIVEEKDLAEISSHDIDVF